MRRLYLKRVGEYWYAEQHITVGGKTKRKTLPLKVKGRDKKATARRRLKELEIALSKRPEHRITPYLSRYVSEYLEEVSVHLKPTSVRSYRHALARALSVLPDLPLSEYKPVHFERLKVDLSEEIKPRSVNMVLRTLSALFNYSVRMELLNASPLRHTKQASVPRSVSPITWTRADFDVFALDCPSRLLTAAALAFFCGLRVSEVSSLSWDDIEDTRILIRVSDIQRTKSDRPRVVPVPGVFWEYVERGKGRACPLSKTRLSWYFTERVQTLPVPRITFHGLRHSYASHLARSGVPIAHIQKLLGHATIQTTMIYAHVSEESAIDSVGKVAW